IEKGGQEISTTAVSGMIRYAGDSDVIVIHIEPGTSIDHVVTLIQLVESRKLPIRFVFTHKDHQIVAGISDAEIADLTRFMNDVDSPVVMKGFEVGRTS